MEVGFTTNLLFVLLAALAGGFIVRIFKFQPLLGYILGGVVFGSFLPIKWGDAEKMAEIGAIFLLFSVGLELSFARLTKVLKIATLGAVFQIILVTLLSYALLAVFGVDWVTALILSVGFSLSSTAIVVKILTDRGELDSIHGEVMIGWLLIQDMATIPIMVLIPFLTQKNENVIASIGTTLGLAMLTIILTVFFGRLLVPFIIHKIVQVNSRELLVLTSVFFAIGTAVLTSLFGISPILGAFLAGVVISESQENHAVFAEVRPLRDLFVAIFFVTLGFIVNLGVVLDNLGMIFLLAAFVMVIKFVITFFASLILGYHGKVAISISVGLSQIGEFAFIIFTLAKSLGLISDNAVSIGIATGLLSLIVTPLLFKAILPLWRKIRGYSNISPRFQKLLLGWDKKKIEVDEEMTGHAIICGYGRVGSWVGHALTDLNIPFVVVDYDQSVTDFLSKTGVDVIYGDPSEPEILEAAGITRAKFIVIAIPDRVAQIELVAHVRTVAPNVKIISRVHWDEDFDKLKVLNVDKIVQPEFEAAITIIRTILSQMGKPKDEITKRIKSLRLSKAMT